MTRATTITILVLGLFWVSGCGRNLAPVLGEGGDADADGDTDTDADTDADTDSDIDTDTETTTGDEPGWTMHSVDDDIPEASMVLGVDIDGDGDVDVVGASIEVNAVLWWENTAGDGETWFQRSTGSAVHPTAIHAGDLDGDGDLDVLAAGWPKEIAWYDNAPWEVTSDVEHDVAHDTSKIDDRVAVADIDGDGDLDVFSAPISTHFIEWWENTDGVGATWVQHELEDCFDMTSSLVSADLDGDGDADVAAVSAATDEVAWWENAAGDGTLWLEHEIEDNSDGAVSLHAVDLDGDGDIDLVAAARYAGQVTWWENVGGSGVTWTKRWIEGALEGVGDIQPADMDGDGDPDILGASQEQGMIVWWENEL